jgi:para-aminobenzoate synthetase component I
MSGRQLTDFKEQLNEWGRNRVPFLFLIDFELKKPVAWRVDEVSPDELLYSFNQFSNTSAGQRVSREIQVKKVPMPLGEYERKFNQVYDHLLRGDSFLTNLTIKTSVQTPMPLQELFYLSEAKYKCWWRHHFLFFSPETFIQIRNGKIHSYPMKGTIDASVENAHRMIQENKKELAEHITIVDLIRNDVSQVATHVTISRFRYIDEVVAHDKKLLQVSSEISGDLPGDYHLQLGEIIISLLPAGSVSGAPKVKTCEIIRAAEGEDRGYYTGVFGYFDGENVDSGVAIRYLEQMGDKLYYRSGGGITALSVMEEEYREAIQKIYVPVS